MTTNKRTPTALGLHYLAQGFHLITQKGIRRFVVVPLLINLIIYALLIWAGVHYFDEFSSWIQHYLPSWLGWLSTIIWLLFLFTYLAVLVYTFSFIANLVSAPFNSTLSDKIQAKLTGRGVSPESFAATLKDAPRALHRQFKILGYYLPRAILLLILFLIPLINAFASILWFLFNSWMMTMQYIDYPMDNNKKSFSALKKQLHYHRALSFSFGIGVMVLSFIPIVNFVVIPAAVAGATAMWVDHQQHQQ